MCIRGFHKAKELLSVKLLMILAPLVHHNLHLGITFSYYIFVHGSLCELKFTDNNVTTEFMRIVENHKEKKKTL